MDSLVEYPTNWILWEDWQKVNWQKTPYKEWDIDFVDFAFGRYWNNLDEYEDLLTEEGNYFSYTYKLHPQWNVWNIEFFILNPNKGILIYINSNT